jgi:hypothetical protein
MVIGSDGQEDERSRSCFGCRGFGCHGFRTTFR